MVSHVHNSVVTCFSFQKYDPDRFGLDARTERAKKNAFAFVPFSAGPRYSKTANYDMQDIIANLM